MISTDKLSVELEFEMLQWNQLVQLLQEVAAPNRVTTPLIQEIVQKLHAKEAATGSV